MVEGEERESPVLLEREMVRRCELCDFPARMYCESDQASLCWSCDSKVHGANFLVARHSRTLLCQGCQARTPWAASGPNLGPTVSLCQKCSGEGDHEEDERESVDGVDDVDLDDDNGEEEEDDGDGDGDGENQVVPWSSSSTTTTPPPLLEASSSSSEEEDFSDSEMFSRKRSFDTCCSDPFSKENVSRSIRRRENNPTMTDRRTGEPESDRTVEGRVKLINGSMERIERDIASGLNTPVRIAGLCELSRNLDAV